MSGDFDDDWFGADDPDDEPAAPAGDPHDARVQAGLEHLQRAAHEMIAASRALLDVFEDLVDDPKAAASVVDLLGSVSARRFRGMGGAGPAGPAPGADDGDDDPPVQRIPVS